MFPKIPAVYMITNTVTGKFYIGSTVNLYARLKYHRYSANRNSNKELGGDILKYGFDAFNVTILETPSLDQLREREKFYIESLNAVENGYNITKATTNSDKMRAYNLKAWQNKEYREKRSKASSELQKKRLQNPQYLLAKSKQLKDATDKMKRQIGMYTKNGAFVTSFNGVREAARYLVSIGATNSKHASSILSDACDPEGRHKTAYNYIWKYL